MVSGYLVLVVAAVAGAIVKTKVDPRNAMAAITAVGRVNLLNIKNSLKSFEGERGRLNE